jgi:hypothetical protein
MAALGNLLSQQGVAPSSFDIPFNPETSPAAFVSPEQLIGQFVPPDPPPPRA